MTSPNSQNTNTVDFALARLAAHVGRLMAAVNDFRHISDIERTFSFAKVLAASQPATVHPSRSAEIIAKGASPQAIKLAVDYVIATSKANRLVRTLSVDINDELPKRAGDQSYFDVTADRLSGISRRTLDTLLKDVEAFAQSIAPAIRGSDAELPAAIFIEMVPAIDMAIQAFIDKKLGFNDRDAPPTHPLDFRKEILANETAFSQVFELCKSAAASPEYALTSDFPRAILSAPAEVIEKMESFWAPSIAPYVAAPPSVAFNDKKDWQVPTMVDGRATDIGFIAIAAQVLQSHVSSPAMQKINHPYAEFCARITAENIAIHATLQSRLAQMAATTKMNPEQADVLYQLRLKLADMAYTSAGSISLAYGVENAVELTKSQDVEVIRGSLLRARSKRLEELAASALAIRAQVLDRLLSPDPANAPSRRPAP